MNDAMNEIGPQRMTSSDVFRHGGDLRSFATRATPSAGRRTRSAAHGFTLVELMVVVLIVGILATMGVVGYRKLVSESHSTEAVQVINSIRVAQEMWHAENGQYDDVSATLCLDATTCASMYPQAFFTHPANHTAPGSKVGNYKVQWGGSCTGECGKWLSLPVRSPGAVMHGYSTKAGIAGVGLPSLTFGGTPITWPEAGAVEEWYLITAVGDVDEDGTAAVYMATSFNNDLLAQNEGE